MSELGIGHGVELMNKGVDIPAGIFDSYYRRTRYEPFQKCVAICKREGFRSIVDIGTGNGHLVYLARLEGIGAIGLDIVAPDSVNRVFIEKFGEKCIFYGDFNDTESMLKYSGDCVTSINLTHIFDLPALEHLLRILSNMGQYALIHVRKPMANCLKNLGAGIEYLKVFDLYDNEVIVLFKFQEQLPIDHAKKFRRTDQTIHL